MKNGIPHVAIGEVISKSDEWIDLDPTQTYQQVTIKMWGQGVVQRNEVSGGEIASTRRLKVRAGQFILSRIDARNGALGLVPETLHGAVVSNDFPAFNLDISRIMPEYLGWMSKTHSFVELCKAASEGTTNRVRLQEDLFLALRIPLPPLSEQHRIVTRIEELAAKIEEARRLRREAIEQVVHLLPGAITEVTQGNWPIFELQDIVDSTRPITYGIVQAGDHIEDGVPYIRVSDMAKSALTTEGMLRTAPWIADKYRRSMVKTGDIVFAIRATVGKMHFVPEELDGANLTQGTARIAPGDKTTGSYLKWILQNRIVVAAIDAACKGSTFREITLGRLRTLKIPLPPLLEQYRIVAYLDSLQAKVDALKALQAETQAELDAMLPAVLDKAFKGEL